MPLLLYNVGFSPEHARQGVWMSSHGCGSKYAHNNSSSEGKEK